jgi:hypothetical protein
MSKSKRYVCLLTLCLLVCSSVHQDICTDQAALVLYDEFYLTQDYESEIKLNFNNYFTELNKISKDIVPFEKNALKYDTEAELDELESSPLIPYTHDTNLIQIKSLNKDFMASCATRDAKVLDIDPLNIEAIKEIMARLNISTVPFRTFDDRGAQISALSGTVFKNAPVPSTDNKLLLRFFFPTYTSETGTITYPTNDSIQSTTPIDGFCMKPNNIWDRKGPSRNKWLTLINKVISNISQVKSWKDSFSTLFTTLPTIDQLYAKVTDKLVPNTPLPLAGISNFISKYKSNSNWESSTPSAFTEFQNFLKNFKSLSKVFMKIPSLPNRKLQLSGVSNITETRITELVAAPFDNERIQRFLDLHPDKVNITGPVSIKPIYKIRGQDEGVIGAIAKFKIYDSNDKIKIYQVKPLVYQGLVTTATHVVISSKYKQALTQTPTPFGCQREEDTNRNEENIRICRGYTTPGLETLSSIDSHICGVALSTLKGEVHFSKCPKKPAPSTPLAYRVSCDNKTVVISSVESLKIRVFCDGFSGTDITLLKSFPVYLQTNCEIKQIKTEGYEPVLLPQLHSDFLLQQPIASIEMSPQNKASIETEDPSPDYSAIITTNVTTTEIPPLINKENALIGVAGTFAGLLSMFTTWCLIKYKKKWTKFYMKHFCCCSKKYNPFGCKDRSCYKKCCKGSSSASDSSESDSDEEPSSRKKKTKKHKKSKNLKKENIEIAMQLLPHPPASAPVDNYLEPELTGQRTPTSVKSFRDGSNTYGKQQPRTERYNNTYNK